MRKCISDVMIGIALLSDFRNTFIIHLYYYLPWKVIKGGVLWKEENFTTKDWKQNSPKV